MKKLNKGLILVTTIVFALLGTNLVFSAGAVKQYGPIPSTSTDSGTCGNDWAKDTFDRHFKVNTSPNPDGTYTVVEEFKKGSFVTFAGPSPGACQSSIIPASFVGAGVTGSFEGSFTIVVTGGVFNPAAVCTTATCGTTVGFVATVFGAGATYDVPTFLFHYSA